MALITTTAAAQELGVTPRTIRNLIKSGLLPAVRVMSEYRIDENDITRFISANKTAGTDT